ncbi:MAG: DUF58 domain-containing protein [Magnetospiraceae bacterium]
MTSPVADPLEAAYGVASAFPALQVAAERVAATVALGVHGRRRIGRGETFWQFRRYQYGDPAQLIDWRRSARSHRYYVRQTEWEASQTVSLWVDGSPSMAWASLPSVPEKRHRGALLMLALAILLRRAGERTAALGLPLSTDGPEGLARLGQALYEGPAETDGLPPVLPPPPAYSRVVLAGDFLAPVAALEPALRTLAARPVTGHLVQIIDPAEEDFPYDGRVDFHGLEGETPRLFDRTRAIRDTYREAFAAHQREIAGLAARMGWRFTTHRTDHSPETVLLTLYQQLAADGSGVQVRC